MLAESFNQTHHSIKIYITNLENSSAGHKAILDTQIKNYEHLKINNANDEQEKWSIVKQPALRQYIWKQRAR